MSLARTLSVVSLLALAFMDPLPARADDVIPPKVLVRKFPQGQFCALPISIRFTAPATPIMVSFIANQWVSDGSTLQWTDQAIDNVTVALGSTVDAHFAGPPAGGNSENCYNRDPPDPPVSYFHFNGLTIPILEQFDSNPAARGWSGTAGTSFVTGRSAPRDVDLDTDRSGGAYRLGTGLGTPDANATESATLAVTGLTPGQEYDLSAWWDCNFVRFPHDVTYLTITITTGSTPIAKKSWGAFKTTYR